jgi:hypothetical protein
MAPKLPFPSLLTLGLSFVFQTGFHSVAQAGLELWILLPQLPKSWNYRHAPSYSALGSYFPDFLFLFLVLELEFRASSILSTHSYY